MKTTRTLSVLLLAIVMSFQVHAQGQSDLFVVTSDFATGSAALLPAGWAEAQINLLTVHADAIGQFHDGHIYIINRLGQDNVIVMDASRPSEPLTQFSVGNGTNPHQIHIVTPEKAYVTRYDDASLLVVDPRDGSELGTIDLSAFADGDGLPEMSEMIRVDDYIYVALQRLDRNNGWISDASYLVAIDPATDQIVDLDAGLEGIQGVTLSAPNPNSVVAAGNRIAVGVVAGFGDRVGGIDVIDPIHSRSLGLAVSEEDLGGDISLLTMASATTGFAVVSDKNFANLVKPFDLSTGVVGAPLDGLSGGFISTIVVDGDRLIVGDRGSFADPAAAGLKIYDVATGQAVGEPIDTGLPPASIVPLHNVATAIVATSDVMPASSSLEAAYPNPFNATVRIPMHTTGGALEVVVYNELGQRMRTLLTGSLPAGGYDLSWDGVDDKGTTVGSGTYIIQLQGGDLRQTRKVTLLK